MPHAGPRLKRISWGMLGGTWIVLIGLGQYGLGRYANTAGQVGPAPVEWPSGSRIVPEAGKWTLVVAVHPLCPCSRATAEELAGVLDRCGGRVSAHALIYEPTDDPEASGWGAGLSRELAAIPGVRLVRDADGVEAARFGARTSGQVLLYGPDGRRRFRGGITPSRGHRGENPGSEAVAALVLGESNRDAETPVFGCPILAPEDPTGEPDPSTR